MQTIRVSLTGSAYDVRIGPSLLKTVGQEALRAARSRRAFLVTNRTVARAAPKGKPEYLRQVKQGLRAAGLQAASKVMPDDGERSKTLAQAGRLCDRMLRAGMDRGSVLIALGGGVITDLAGFAAAIYMRGIAWIAVPTSLLAQVDASVGGKTAVNHPECKNMIGAFHQPAAVLCDTDTLATLPDEEFRTGLAEVVKHAVIRDADLFALLEAQADAILARDPAVLEAVVARNVRIKAEVVMADERESDLRRILNYGHTIGHALETRLKVRHGRAVALGMVAEAHIALGRGLIGRAVADRQDGLLKRFGLPTRLDEAPDVDACLVLVKHDKKAVAGRHHVILPTALGRVEVFSDVTDREICEAIASLK